MTGDNLNIAPPVGVLQGAVDNFIPPRLISGWVRDSEKRGNGLDITVSIYLGDRLIARGPPTRSRPDIVASPDYLTEFRLVCSEDVPDEKIAFDLLRIVAHDSAGRTARLYIWDRVRGFAFGRVLEIAPSLGKAAAAALLQHIGRNANISPEAREAVLDAHDLHFEEEDRRLLYQFESLGKDCSLGAVQRAYGAEPLGLLRFAGIGVESVIAAIRNRFRGVGAPEFTRLIASDTKEYYSSDTRYGMSSHTFMYEEDVAFERFFEQQCKKISFLARNILEKLAEGEKIFVVHAIPESLSTQKLQTLLSAIREIGRSSLLYLRAPSPDLPAGQLTTRDDGIMEGSVLQFQGVEAAAGIRESWIKVLRQAEQLARQTREPASSNANNSLDSEKSFGEKVD
jgi:hypothetical protein